MSASQAKEVPATCTANGEGESPSRRATAQAAKRQQIMDAARKIFIRLGYDGASMNDVAAEAGVSKATLYVYFTNKEALFAALIQEMVAVLPENALSMEHDAGDLRQAMIDLGVTLMLALTRPEHLQFHRLVLGTTEKFPQFGRLLHESGPARGIAKMRAFLERERAHGHLAIDDLDRAAHHLLDLMKSRYLLDLMLGVRERPSEAELRASITAGVDVFLSHYGRKPHA